jgi:hypothetical protein
LLERAKVGEQAKVMEKQLSDAREVLAAAQSAAAGVRTITSDVTPMIQFIADRSGQTPQQVKWIESAQPAIINMLLVSLAGLAMGLADIRGKPRTPIFGGAFGRVLRGRQDPADALASSITRNGTVTLQDNTTRAAFMKALEKLPGTS